MLRAQPKKGGEEMIPEGASVKHKCPTRDRPRTKGFQVPCVE